MDSFIDEAKLFIGGIGWDTTEERLRDHFSRYGEVAQAVVMRDRVTSQPRGFGFVVFSDPSVIPSVLQQTHNINGRTLTPGIGDNSNNTEIYTENVKCQVKFSS